MTHETVVAYKKLSANWDCQQNENECTGTVLTMAEPEKKRKRSHSCQCHDDQRRSKIAKVHDIERKSDHEFHRQLIQLSKDDFHQQRLDQLFPPQVFALNDSTVYVTTDSASPPLQVPAEIASKLQRHVENETGKPTKLTAHCSQFVQDRETRLWQLCWSETDSKGEPKWGDQRSLCVNTSTFCEIFGNTAVEDNKKFRSLLKNPTRPQSINQEIKSQSLTTWPDVTISVPSLLRPAKHSTNLQLIRAIESIFQSIKQGLEPDVTVMLTLQPDISKLLIDIAELRQAHVLSFADQCVLIEALEQKESEDRVIGNLSAVSEAEAEAEDAADRPMTHKQRIPKAAPPKNRHQLKMLSRKLFGVVGQLKRQGHSLGYQVLRIPAMLQPCIRCRCLRQVDARPSQAALQRFHCGSVFQINSETPCFQPHESLKGNHAWIWQIPSTKLFIRD